MRTGPFAGLRDRSANDGGDSVRRLFHALLRALRFHDALLFQETPAN
jgi:hypothetical protein